MLTQNQIKQIRSLQQKKFRTELNQFVAEGPKLIEELIDSKYTFDCVYAKKEWIDNHSEKLLDKKISSIEINNKELDRISGLVSPNSALAVLKIPEENINMEIFGKELILVLDNIKDPGNMGTIIRTADWFGINHIICSESTVDAYNPKVVQATMGSIARVNIHYTDLEKLFSEISKKTSIYGTFTDGVNIHDVEADSKGVIVIGNESNGISTEFQSFIHKRISIPLFKTNDKKRPESLNASVATAIICYEFRKIK